MIYLSLITTQMTLKDPSFTYSHWMQSSRSASLQLPVFSFHCLPLHLTLTFFWLIPCLLTHSSCQANKRLFCFPMEPYAKAWERDRVSGGWRKASGLGLPEGQDRCLLAGSGRNSGWWNRWRSSDKCDLALLGKRKRLLAPQPPLAQFSVCWLSLCELRAVIPFTQQTGIQNALCCYLELVCW